MNRRGTSRSNPEVRVEYISAVILPRTAEGARDRGRSLWRARTGIIPRIQADYDACTELYRTYAGPIPDLTTVGYPLRIRTRTMTYLNLNPTAEMWRMIVHMDIGQTFLLGCTPSTIHTRSPSVRVSYVRYLYDTRARIVRVRAYNWLSHTAFCRRTDGVSAHYRPRHNNQTACVTYEYLNLEDTRNTMDAESSHRQPRRQHHPGRRSSTQMFLPLKSK